MATPILKRGATGAAVTVLQQRLSQLGFTAPVTGTFDVETEVVVRTFQIRNLLEDDGEVGELTLAAITGAEAGATATSDVSPFRARLAAVAEVQHEMFHTDSENDPVLVKQIKAYYTSLDFTFVSVDVAWSAVFVSYCVQQAGATENEFLFAQAHSRFVNAAIANADNDRGVFRGIKISSSPLQVGDILQNNRGGTTHDFAFARSHDRYESHSAVVVQVVKTGSDHVAFTVGGNEGDSIRLTKVLLNKSGTVKQRSSNPYIAIVRTTK